MNDDFSFKVIDPDTNEVEEIFAIEIQYLGVHNDHQKQGIGKQIIYHIFEICKRLNHRFVFLQSVVSAVEYYKKFNFKELELETTPERAVSLYTDLLDPTVVESYWNP